jgi:hypothetical protein
VKIRMIAAAALVLAAACGGQGASPDEGPSPAQGRMAGGAGPVLGGSGPNVFALIGARQQLALTGAQVTELDSIGRVWSVRNDSLQRQLRDYRGGRTDLGLVRPILERMAENNGVANQAVEALLNPEQRRIACTLTPPEPARPQTMRPPGSARVGGRGGRMRPARGGGDTVPGMRLRRGWPWCAAPVAADSAG